MSTTTAISEINKHRFGALFIEEFFFDVGFTKFKNSLILPISS
jgi:hypothetical protein